MADIIDFLIKYGFVVRSPISPTGTHLYGMASYLVLRSKPNSLGRLIVDYSPINSLIESPANVIPEVSATLQYLLYRVKHCSLDWISDTHSSDCVSIQKAAHLRHFLQPMGHSKGGFTNWGCK
jgi:hypothetical protein